MAPRTIPSLTAATLPLDGSEEIPLQQGATTCRATVEQVRPRSRVAAVGPTPANDSSQGYGPGSTWQDTATGYRYTCLSGALGAAIWRVVPRRLFFTVSGTFTPPAPGTWIGCLADAVGGGGGGGSGRRGPAGSTRFGGGGGGGGGRTGPAWIAAAAITGPVAVTVGAAGSPGAAVLTDNTNGGNGTSGGETLFGSLLRATGGGLGQGGTTAAGAAGNAGTGEQNGSAGGAGSSATGSAGATSVGGGAGGGGGAGVPTGNTPNNGGNGGTRWGAWAAVAAAPGGVGAGAAGAAGADAPAESPQGGGGGGGGASGGSAAPGGPGGQGGTYGAGGGGGGASQDGRPSGAGGPGRGGCLTVEVF
jgi:hypothetical protein